MLAITIFETLLFKGSWVLSPAQRVTGSEKIKYKKEQLSTLSQEFFATGQNFIMNGVSYPNSQQLLFQGYFVNEMADNNAGL